MIIKRLFWNFINKVISHKLFQEVFCTAFPRVRDPSINPELKQSIALSDPPHADLPSYNENNLSQPIFITARFRSGSTLLWHIFRQLKDVHCYYEPLNERMWFDKEARKTFVDTTHRGVSDYWKEYDNIQYDKNLFLNRWAHKRLLMDSTSHEPLLKQYIGTLIQQSPCRPLLQFNRVDFRLEWLKANFCSAKIIHLYRDPRDQWISVSSKSPPISHRKTGHDYSSYNLFYTIPWARDLSTVFPFLSPTLKMHPYYYHYLLWRLSYTYGRTYSDISVAFEDLVNQTEPTLQRLFNIANINVADINELSNCISKPALGKWTIYASDSWYREIEAECDELVHNFFR